MPRGIMQILSLFFSHKFPIQKDRLIVYIKNLFLALRTGHTLY